MITIRAAVGTDASAIASLSGELGYPGSGDNVGHRLAVLAADPAQCVRVAEDADGSVIGWAHAAEQMVLESGLRCELLGLVVAAAGRRSGAGRALVAAIEQWAAERHLPVVSLRCNEIRTAAHAFYARLGYDHAKTQRAFRKRLPGADASAPMA